MKTENILELLQEETPPLIPADFFQFSLDIHYIKEIDLESKLGREFRLPEFSKILGEKNFIEAFLAWNEEGVLFQAYVDKPFQQSFFPNFRAGDSIELYFDTRDLKEAKLLTKFCHQFVITLEPVDGIYSREMTHFRTEDAHPVAEPNCIEIRSEFHRRNYFISTFIPSEILFGYDPSSFNRLGFSYRFNLFQEEANHFTFSSKYFMLQHEPHYWASLFLQKE
ncbi:MAG: hypothetical protein L0207_06630 [Chlamydiae bacterium]|nr:hypothetical protein [Chlamydiota bacterium]